MNSTSAQDEDAILSSPKGSTSSKSPENPTESSADTSSTPSQQKKIVLKRKLLPSVSLTEKDEPITSADNKVMKMSGDSTDEDGKRSSSEINSSNESAENVVKLSQLTMKERLEMRAKKFGAPVTGEAAKLARAERFGVEANVNVPKKTGNLVVDNIKPNLDVLKKRAERFGGSVSNAMVKIEQNEKLLKRQERFGDSAASTISGTVTTTKTPIATQAADSYAEKAKLRLERFKTTA